MKAHLENSQEEVTTGARGVTSDQKGPERAKWAYRAKKGLLSTVLLIKNSFLRFSTQNQLTNDWKIKAQLESSQEEVTTGAQGVTSGQKGPERARKGQKGPIGPKRPFKHHIIDKKQLFTIFDSKDQLTNDWKIKAQLENSQKEVTTGAQGVASGQKGPERAKMAKKALWAPYY
jgi:hypothetical protein